MNLFITHLTTSLRQLSRNKARAGLTMLGIIIGIGSVIFILTAGEIAKNFLLSQISQFGTNVIEVASIDAFNPLGSSDDNLLTDEDVELLENSSLLPEITGLSAGYTVIEKMENDSNSEPVTIFGDRPDVFSVNNIKVKKGRLFNSGDYQNAARVVVVGESLAKDMFSSTNVVGEQVKVSGKFFTIIGVIEDFGAGPLDLGSDIIFVPLTTVRRLFVDPSKGQEITFMLIEFEHGTNVESFISRLEYELRNKHDLLDSDEEPFLIVSREQALSIFDSILLGVQAFISAVAGISLLVGGIGIMNIMLVTVKERTKEIGLRKAIGAKNSSILSQFLIESVVLTTVGGIIGILMGLGLSLLAVIAVNFFQPDWGVSFVFVPSALLLASGVSITVGLIFGIYPAVKASRLHPIEALRYE